MGAHSVTYLSFLFDSLICIYSRAGVFLNVAMSWVFRKSNVRSHPWVMTALGWASKLALFLDCKFGTSTEASAVVCTCILLYYHWARVYVLGEANWGETHCQGCLQVQRQTEFLPRNLLRSNNNVVNDLHSQGLPTHRFGERSACMCTIL